MGVEAADDRYDLAAGAAFTSHASGLDLRQEHLAGSIPRTFAVLKGLAARFASNRRFQWSSVEEAAHAAMIYASRALDSLSKCPSPASADLFLRSMQTRLPKLAIKRCYYRVNTDSHPPTCFWRFSRHFPVQNLFGKEVNPCLMEDSSS